MSLRPNPIPTIIRMLSEAPSVTALVEDRIFGGKLPTTYTDMMPINAIVITRAGGVQPSLYVPMHAYRIQINCYGGYGETVEGAEANEYQASLVSSAVCDVLCDAGPIYDDLTVIKQISLSVGPNQMKDEQMNNTPLEVLFFRVYMPTVQMAQIA